MSHDDIDVRLASWAIDGPALSGIRKAVFAEEYGIDAGLDADAQDVDASHALAVSAHGQAIGTGRLLADGQIGRMAVLPEWRGRGVGESLLANLLMVAQYNAMNRLWLNAQESAIGFYLTQQFVQEGAAFVEAGIVHQKMVRVLAGEKVEV